MNRRLWKALGLVLLLAAAMRQPAVAAENTDLNGRWKLVLLSFNEFPFGLFEISGAPADPKAEIVHSPRGFGELKVSSLKRDGDVIRLEITAGARNDQFTGTVPKEADKPILGVMRFQGRVHPARLERTTDEETGAPVGGSLSAMAGKIAIDKELSPVEKVAKFREAIREHASSPGVMNFYDLLVRNAEKAELSPDEVRAAVKDWLAGAAPYGADWTMATRDRILNAIGAQTKYAALKLDVAQDAQKELPKDAAIDRRAELARIVANSAKDAGNEELAKTADAMALKLEKEAASARMAKADADLKSLPETAPTEVRAALTRIIAESATVAGATDIAKRANEDWQKLEAKLDDEYHQNVPPFKPEPFAGRKDPQDNRVVVLELFTGAQCPPCVAADVAFDALVSSYKPTEFIGLQYHLHIPGPDPLTNADTEARAKYYGVRSTPSTLFNGESLSGGGGPMMNAQKKYGDYLQIIGDDLADRQPAKIDLKLTRSGDRINVTASAQAEDAAVTAARAGLAKRVAVREAAEAAEQAAKEAAEDAAEAEKVAKGDKTAEDEQKRLDERKKEAAEKAEADKKAAAEKEPVGAPQLRLRFVLVQEEVHYVGGNKLRYHHHVVRATPGGMEGKELVAGQAENSVTVDLAEVRAGLEQYLADYPKEARPFPEALPPIDLTNLSVVALVQDDADKQILGAVQVAVPEAK